MPTGYNIGGPSKLGNVPECEQTPPLDRRESVHVSTIIDDVPSKSGRLRDTFSYRDSSTNTSGDVFKISGELGLSSNINNKSHTSNINYYFDTKLNKTTCPKSAMIAVEAVEQSAHSKPVTDFDRNFDELSKSDNKERQIFKISSQAMGSCLHKSKKGSYIVEDKRQKSRSMIPQSYSSTHKAHYDILTENDHETKYRSVLNVSKGNSDSKSKDSDFEHVTSNISSLIESPFDDNQTDEYHRVEHTNDYQNLDYDCVGITDSCSAENTETTRSKGSSESSLAPQSTNKNESVNSISSVVTICSDIIAEDDVFIPESDYEEAVYETVDIGVQLRARGESINSTHV